MSAKILRADELDALRLAARARGQRVVHCHGCFDIVHPGHVRHLRQAKALGDVLLVSLTADAHVGKGADRPLIPEELRAENLAALDFVDWVYINPDATAEGLLDRVRPDVYVKGREYESNTDARFLAERAAVERHGGRVVFSSGDVVFSSSALIATLHSSVDPFHHRLGQLLASSELALPELSGVVAAMRGRRVLVVGETILDTYVLCDKPGVAGESPVLTLRPIERRQYDGGAAIIARHCAALGARPTLVTALPQNEAGDAFRTRLATEGVDVLALPVRTPIAEKQRFLVGTQKVMKLDLVERLVLDAAEHAGLRELASYAASADGGCEAAIVTDFGLGLFTTATLGTLFRSLRPKVGVLAGDVSGRRPNLLSMRDADLLCPSEGELRDALHLHEEGLPMAAWRLLEETGAKSAIVTMGAEGLIAFAPLTGLTSGGEAWRTRLKSEHVPALCPTAVDALGCGDALLATATLAKAAGAGTLQAAFLGACAAAAEVQRMGNLPIGANDLRRTLAGLHGSRLAYVGPDAARSAAAS